MLDLQALIDQTYVNGAYDSIDYVRPPNPPFSPDAAVWAKGVLDHISRLS